MASGNVQWYSLHNLRGDLVASYQGTSPQVVRDWDAYGGYYTLRGGTDTDFRYVADKSVVYDTSTQWYSMGRRSYSWLLGRFITQDPIGYAGGTTNLYSYCGDNPVTNVDPDGLEYLILGNISGMDVFAPSMWTNAYHWGSRSGIVAGLKGTTEDRVSFWGHGAPGKPTISCDATQTITREDWLEIAQSRARAGLPKFKFVNFHQCAVLSDYDYIDAILQASERVGGYEGWTLNPATLSPGVWREYSKAPGKGVVPDSPKNYLWGGPKSKNLLGSEKAKPESGLPPVKKVVRGG